MQLLICDDQNSVHTFLQHSIDWKSLGISAILHAYTGEECLDLLSLHLPDILLLDIKLPHMTGIDILEKMKELHLNTTTIILSAYNEFTYAKDALRYGAFAYELKPIDSLKLTPVVEQAIQYQTDKYHAILSNYLNGNSHVSNDCSFILNRLQISSYCGILISLSEDYSLEQYLQAEEQLHARFSHIIELNYLEFFVLYPITSDFETAKSEIHSLYDLLSSTISAAIQFDISCVGEGFHFLQTSLQQCQEAHFSHFHIDNNIIFYEGPTSIDSSAEEILYKFEKKINTCLSENGTYKQLSALLNDMFKYISKIHLKSDRVKGICEHLILYNISTLRNVDESALLIRQEILDCPTSMELQDVVTEKLAHYFFEQEENHKKATLQDVYRYLSTHYAENITLDKLSQKFYISKYTLCRNFRSEYQESLWTFLKRIRMEQAHFLLTSTDLKIYEVAAQCGFIDANYFSNTYRKFFGHSPQQDKNE